MKKKYLLLNIILLTVFGCQQNNNKLKLKEATTIITNGIIVTVDSIGTIFPNGSVVINGDEIVAIGTSAEIAKIYYSDNIVDAKGKIVMPGLINCHTHLSMTLFRGIADDLELKDWLEKYIFPAEAEFMNAENVEIGSQLAMIEMIHTGTTTFNDMYFYEDKVAEVAKKIGMRGVVSESLIDFPVPNSKTSDEGISHIRKMVEKYKNDSLITVGLAVHSPYTCGPDLLKKAKKVATELNLIYNIHVAETKWEIDTINKLHHLTPVEYLDKLGVLDHKTIAAHGVWLTDNDINILSKRGVSVAHNPECNMKLSSGAAPIVKMVELNCNIGLGTDGVASNNNLNMFEEMHTMALLAKISTGNPTSIPAEKAIRIATIGGAKLLGKEKEIGSLEVGKKADIIIINANRPNTTPLYNVYSTLVYAINANDVNDVIINGKFVLRNSNILNISEEEVMSNVRKKSRIIAKKLKEKNPDHIFINLLDSLQ
jgi:5-methylthioadenosine/S-adenosylhomocysteine deaminase